MTLNIEAKAILTLYRAKRITIEGIRRAVENKIITKEQFKEITGQDY